MAPPARKRGRKPKTTEQLTQVAVEVPAITRTIDTSKYFLSEKLSDCKIVVGSKEFPAHRFVLAEISDFCDRMFSTEMIENKTRVWKIDDFDPAVVEEFLEYAYKGTSKNLTSEAESDTEILKQLFSLSDKYGISPLKLKCVRLLRSRINVTNVVSLFYLGFLHKSSSLMTASKNHFKSSKLEILPDLDALRKLEAMYPDDMIYELVIR